MEEPKVTYTPPIFPDQTVPNGELTRAMECQACWYYYVLAHKSWAESGKSIDDQFGILEGELWLSPAYEQVARSVATIYGLKDPSEFMKFWPQVTAETLRLGMEPPKDVYMKPLRLVH